MLDAIQVEEEHVPRHSPSRAPVPPACPDIAALRARPRNRREDERRKKHFPGRALATVSTVSCGHALCRITQGRRCATYADRLLVRNCPKILLTPKWQAISGKFGIRLMEQARRRGKASRIRNFEGFVYGIIE